MFSTSYFGLFLGTFSESFFVPLPSEILMGLAGFLINEGKFVWYWVIFFAVMGNVVSTAIVWKLGHTFGEKFILKYGGYVGYEEEELNQAKKLFDKWGYPVIFVCQLLPVMRSVITVPAGVLKTKLLPTLVATGCGATIWLSLWTYVGVKLGENWSKVSEIAKPYEMPITLIILVFIAYYLFKHIRIVIKKNLLKAKITAEN